jgi:hypothetical protein
MQDLSPDEMYGIAKKVNREFSEYPLHTHAALSQLISIGFQHRQVAEQRAEKLEHDKLQERDLKLREQATELMRAQTIAAAGGKVLQPAAYPATGGLKAGPESVAQ